MSKQTTTGKIAIIAMCAVGSANLAEAGTDTANLQVSANVISKCTVSTTPVAFTYDPVVANASTGADATASGTVKLQCTKGETHPVTLGFSAQATGTQRKLKSGTDTINYNLYQDSALTSLWGDGTSSTTSPNFGPFASSSTAITKTVYGNMPKGQDPPSGNGYTDTVVATVNF